jgi:uncharacterized protein (TIGR02302 family)
MLPSDVVTEAEWPMQTRTGEAARVEPAVLLEGKMAVARRTILWERLWPALVPPAAVVSLFLAASWLGLWLAIAPAWRWVGVTLFGLALLASLAWLFGLRRASTGEARARLDHDSGMPHRPVETVTDSLATADDAAGKALWQLHQKRAAAQIARLKVSSPDPAMRRRDPMALRFAPFALAIAAAFAGGPDMVGNVTAAFNWTTPVAPPAPPRLDAWLDPPAYTGRAPIFLTRADRPQTGAAATVSAPVNSVFVLRAAPADGISVEAGPGLVEREPPAAPSGGYEKRFTLVGSGVVTIRRGQETLASYTLDAVPDRAPTITLGEIKPTDNREALRIGYRVSDDYGVSEARAQFSRVTAPGETPRRSLVPPPAPQLALPYGAKGDAEGEATALIGDNPWAGARVTVQLFARDDGGNEAQSERREIMLPQRLFSNPLAKALVEQRRDLVIEPDRRDRVQTAIDGLLIEPERFTKKVGTYIGLRIASKRLKAARTDQQLLDVAEWLWTMALDLEDGGLSEAEKALREAQERLKEALERNADAAEIRKLTEELRRAMDRFMRELAEKAQRDNRNADNREPRDNERTISRNDLQKMLDEIEKLSREGKHAEAQQLLEQLRRMMENMQMARGRQQMDPRERGMNEAMDELEEMTREQQELRDRTYRQGQQRRQQMERGRRNQQQGQRGRQGQRQPGQRGQQGEQGDGGEEMGEGGESQEGSGGQSLQQRQERLRQRLQQMQRRMRELGMNGEQGLGDAEQAMRDAEGQLGRGQDGRAVDSQGRALEGLRRGMQGMAQQMQREGEGDGTEFGEDSGDNPGRQGQPRAAGQQRSDDPLGRPTRSREALDGRVRIPELGESAAERARRVLDELRRRLGDPERPRGEIEYFERLLPRN